MPDSSALLPFALASAALIVVPGPAVVYIVTRAVAQGRSAGVISALGIEAGGLVHVAAAAVGLSALVASSATAFSVVKYAGAAYLIALGIQKLTTREHRTLAEAPPARPAALFRQGVVVSALNPKVAIFFVAFLPQFIDPGRAVAPQVAILGALFIAIAAALDIAWALTAGMAGDRLRRSMRARRLLDRVSGATFVGLGAAAALARR